MWYHGSTFIQPVDVFWSYSVTVSARSPARLLLWLAWNSLPDRQSPGSRCYYRQLQALVENVFVFSVYTSAINALDMLRRCALHIYILLTYLLTYLPDGNELRAAIYDQLYSPSGRQMQRNEYRKINNKFMVAPHAAPLHAAIHTWFPAPHATHRHTIRRPHQLKALLTTTIQLRFDCRSTAPFDDYIMTIVQVGCCTGQRDFGWRITSL